MNYAENNTHSTQESEAMVKARNKTLVEEPQIATEIDSLVAKKFHVPEGDEGQYTTGCFQKKRGFYSCMLI